jgi:hypothetical protein
MGTSGVSTQTPGNATVLARHRANDVRLREGSAGATIVRTLGEP